MNLDQAQALKIRLLKRCKYEPTIAEIWDEWKAMKRRTTPRRVSRETPVVYDPAVARLLREQKQAIADGTYRPAHSVTPVLRAYAKRCIPDITEQEIEDNVLEIAASYRDMKASYEPGHAYVAAIMRHGGMIVPCMRVLST